MVRAFLAAGAKADADVGGLGGRSFSGIWRGFQLVMGVPRKRWMVYFRENPLKSGMMTGGTPMT